MIYDGNDSVWQALLASFARPLRHCLTLQSISVVFVFFISKSASFEIAFCPVANQSFQFLNSLPSIALLFRFGILSKFGNNANQLGYCLLNR